MAEPQLLLYSLLLLFSAAAYSSSYKVAKDKTLKYNEKVCGNPQARPTKHKLVGVSHGIEEDVENFPWHVGVYYPIAYGTFEIKLRCSGTIISPFLILTGAHCLMDNYKNEPVPESDIKIAVGKITRSWSVEDPFEQRYDVIRTYIHGDYMGSDGNYGNDIGIIETKRDIVFSEHVMPVCLETVTQGELILDGTLGLAIGWERNNTEKPSKILKKIQMAYQNGESCKRNFNRYSSKELVTKDKFCGVCVEEARPEEGDSGGGYIYLNHEDNLWYIRGIVSVKSRIDKIIYLTNISETSNALFIQNVTDRAFTRRSSAANSSSYQVAKGETQKPVENNVCGNPQARPTKDKLVGVSHGVEEDVENFPWHVGVYYPILNTYGVYQLKLICSGTIISPLLIITGAHCITYKYERKPLPESDIKIAVGKITMSWSVEDPFEQRYDVIRTYIHGDYMSLGGHYGNDIGIIETNRDMVFSEHVMPVCLETVRQGELILDDTPGLAIGWERNNNEKPSKVLKKVPMLYQDGESCKSNFIRYSSKEYVTKDKFCGVCVEEARPEDGDNGGGYIYLNYDDNLWYIRGIVSGKSIIDDIFYLTNINDMSNALFIQNVRDRAFTRRSSGINPR